MTDSAPPVKIWYGWLQGCRRVAGGGYTEPWLPWWVVEVINDKWYQIIIILPAGDLFPPLRYFSSHNYSWLRLGRGGARRRYGSLIESEIFIYFLFSQMSGNLTLSRVCWCGFPHVFLLSAITHENLSPNVPKASCVQIRGTRICIFLWLLQIITGAI